jgi:hypothetical protein
LAKANHRIAQFFFAPGTIEFIFMPNPRAVPLLPSFYETLTQVVARLQELAAVASESGSIHQSL